MWFVTNLCKCLISFPLNFPTFLWLGTFSQLLLFESILNGNQCIRTLLELYSLGPIFPSCRILCSQVPEFPSSRVLSPWRPDFPSSRGLCSRGPKSPISRLLCSQDTKFLSSRVLCSWGSKFPISRGLCFRGPDPTSPKFHKGWRGLIINVSCYDPHCQLNANPSSLHNGDFWHYWGTRLLSALLNRVNKVGAY